MENDQIKYVDIYVRVSDPKQVKGESLDGQERICKQFAEENGYVVSKLFREEGETAREADRPEFKKMMAHSTTKKNNISAVICYHSSRFARNLNDATTFETILNKSNVKLLLVNGTNDQTANGKLIRNIGKSFDQYESDINSERTKLGIEQAVLSGRWLWLSLGFSFADNKDKKRQLLPNDDAKIVKRIFELFNEGIYTQEGIIDILSKEGIEISKQTLNKTLRNSVYCGLLPHPKIYGEYIQGIHEPIITKELFWSVQAILEGRKHTITPPQKVNPFFPLRRHINCPVCGEKWTASSPKGRNKNYPKYFCSNGCVPSISKDVLEAKYAKYLQQMQIEPNLLDLFKKIVIDEFNDQTEYIQKQNKTVEKEIGKLNEQKNTLILKLTSGLLTDEAYKRGSKLLDDMLYEKQSSLVPNETTPNLIRCWESAKFFMTNISSIWLRSGITVKQIVQKIVMPSGFTIRNKGILEPLKRPYFSTVFEEIKLGCQTWGG